jgi:rubrerythrin
LLAKEEMRHKKMLLEISLNTEIKEEIVSEDVNLALQKQINYIGAEGSSVDLFSEKAFFRFALELERNSAEIYQKIMSMIQNDLYEYSKIESIYEEEKNHMVYVLSKLYELK